jgi:hypothetical protein
MSDDRSSQELPTPQIGVAIARSREYRPLFANNSRMRVGPGEITLIFSYIEEIPGGTSGPIMTDLINVSITPTHARRIAITLMETLKAYEVAFGAIPEEQISPPQSLDLNVIMQNVQKELERTKST